MHNQRGNVITDRRFNTASLMAVYLGKDAVAAKSIDWNPDDPNVLSMNLPGVACRVAWPAAHDRCLSWLLCLHVHSWHARLVHDWKNNTKSKVQPLIACACTGGTSVRTRVTRRSQEDNEREERINTSEYFEQVFDLPDQDQPKVCEYGLAALRDAAPERWAAACQHSLSLVGHTLMLIRKKLNGREGAQPVPRHPGIISQQLACQLCLWRSTRQREAYFAGES